MNRTIRFLVISLAVLQLAWSRNKTIQNEDESIEIKILEARDSLGQNVGGETYMGIWGTEEVFLKKPSGFFFEMDQVIRGYCLIKNNPRFRTSKYFAKVLHIGDFSQVGFSLFGKPKKETLLVLEKIQMKTLSEFDAGTSWVKSGEKILIEVLDAIQVAANEGYVIGDLQSKNIGITHNNIVLFDYDSIVAIGEPQKGRQGFMAPEARKGAKPLSDIFGLAVTIKNYLSFHNKVYPKEEEKYTLLQEFINAGTKKNISSRKDVILNFFQKHHDFHRFVDLTKL